MARKRTTKGPKPPVSSTPRADRPGKLRQHPRYEAAKVEILKDLVAGSTLEDSLRRHKLTWWTHHVVTKADPVWAEAVAQARADGYRALAERTLNLETHERAGSAANSWSRSVQWYLERMDRDTYGPRLDVRHDIRINLVVGLEAATERERAFLERRRLELEAVTHDSASCVPDPQDPDQEPDE